jgi:hypothetical protein
MPHSASFPVLTPFFLKVENIRYRLIYTPPKQADAFWLSGDSGKALKQWNNLSAGPARPAGRIWFSENDAGAGQYGMKDDFDIAPEKEDRILLHAGICGEPVLQLACEDKRPVYLSGLLQDAIELCERVGLPVEQALGVRIKAREAILEYGMHFKNGRPQKYDETGAQTLNAFGFMFRKPEHIPRNDAHIRAICEHMCHFPAGGGIYAWLFGQSTSPFLQMQPEPETLFQGPAELQIFLPRRYADAADMLG